jgi:drug/metabolite transporter (DMT)-like permease
MAFYLGLSVAASALLALGLLMMKSRAAELPLAHGARIPGALLAWCRDPIWIGGLGFECAGYALSVVALAGAPVSLVAVMMQGGIALFVLFAILFLGERAGAAEWAAIAGVILAMVMVALSLGNGEAGQRAAATEIAAVSAVLVAAAVAASATPRLQRSGAAAAIVSGLAFGLGSLYTKALTQDFIGNQGGAIIARLAADPYVWMMVAVNVTGMIALQNAFHRGRGIIVMPLSSALSNLVPIFGGIVAFGERLPESTPAAAMRVGAFALTIASGALLSATREAE